jgi:hypothetical protein
MPVTVSKKPVAVIPGAERRTRTELTLDNSSPAEGYSVTPTQLGLRVVTDADCSIKAGSEAEATTVGGATYDPATKKLVVLDYKTQKPMAAGKDLSKVVVVVKAYGR